MVRSAGNPLDLAGPARHALAQIDAGVAPYDFTTMDRLRGEQLQQDRMGTVLIVLFAGFGLLLATLGVVAPPEAQAGLLEQTHRGPLGIHLDLEIEPLRK